MRRDAGFTMFVILIAGLGIGASSTVFSVVNALLLRALPFRDPGQLVWMSNGADWSTQVGHFLDLRQENRSFSDMAVVRIYGVGDAELTGTGGAGAFDQCSRDTELLHSAWRAAGNRTVFHRRGVSGKVQLSSGGGDELRLLATAVCFRPGHSGTEIDDQ